MEFFSLQMVLFLYKNKNHIFMFIFVKMLVLNYVEY